MKFLQNLFKRSSDEDADEDDEDFGSEDFVSNDDGSDVDEGVSTDVIIDDDDNFDSNNADNPDDDDDDVQDGDDDKKDKSRKLIFAGVGAGVLVIGIAAGSAVWMMGDGDTTKPPPPNDERIRLAIPPKSGSLNALTDQSDISPKSGSLNALTGQSDIPPEGEPAEDTGEDEQAQGEQTEAEQSGEATDGEQKDQGPSLLATPKADGDGGSLNALSGASGEGLIIPSVTSTSFRRTRNLQKAGPLASAPNKGLLETIEGIAKPLPKVDSSGRKPWEVYARPLTGSEKGQHVAVMVTGLGLSRAATMAAIRKLPPQVSLVFEPYGKNLEDWLLRARLAGHEVFVSLPMESTKFPNQDPGPMALTTTAQVADNLKRLQNILSSFGGYVGVVSTMGSKFSTADGQMKPILKEVKKRGLMFVDAAATSKSTAPTIAAEIELPVVKNNLVIDDPPTSKSIQDRFKRLETFASNNASAIAMVRPYPVSIHQLQAWTLTLAEKQLALVPVSSLVGKQRIK